MFPDDYHNDWNKRLRFEFLSQRGRPLVSVAAAQAGYVGDSKDTEGQLTKDNS